MHDTHKTNLTYLIGETPFLVVVGSRRRPVTIDVPLGPVRVVGDEILNGGATSFRQELPIVRTHDGVHYVGGRRRDHS
jgi:hypothetical protein